MHSTHSDGSLTPAQLVGMAVSRGVKTIALTDHDTIDGLEELSAAAAHANIEWIPGVEISARLHREIHVLGYCFDTQNETLNRVLARQRQGRIDRVHKICAKLDLMGCVIYPDDILKAAHGNVGRPHIAKALVQAGHANSIQDAFERFLGNEAPAYLPASDLTVSHAIQLIHQAGGVACLAHPAVDKIENKISDLAKDGLDGIEVMHPSHSRSDRKLLTAIAKQYGLLMTGGSDLHHPTGGCPMGMSGVTVASLDRLRLRAQEYAA